MFVKNESALHVNAFQKHVSVKYCFQKWSISKRDCTARFVFGFLVHFVFSARISWKASTLSFPALRISETASKISKGSDLLSATILNVDISQLQLYLLKLFCYLLFTYD